MDAPIESKSEYAEDIRNIHTYSIEEKQINDSAIFENYVKLEYNTAGQAQYKISPTEKRLVRKLDFVYVMPLVILLNFLQFFDKTAITWGSLLGLITDNHLEGDQFNWISSIFYLGYLVFQPVNAIAIQRLPLAKYLGGIIMIWGLVLLLTFKSHNFSQLAGLRFLLGLFEAGVYPCCIVLLSTLYRRKEQAVRIGIVYICSGAAMTFGSLIGYGIGHMQGLANLAGWQWMMVILGAVTILVGIATFFFLVDNPKSKWLRLTKEEEQIVNDRILDNKVVRTKEIKKSHILEALTEIRFYCYIAVALLLSLQNGALSTFTGLITRGFGYDVIYISEFRFDN
ncbi:hypothetical protein EC973_003472 [Apophysomyces ossiformis]|uniref:Major facilitator superfamily (MFS) profile domain-containing protein n=1 Tax=Apophysomyces ossiformis TaxID=679940 RepID=A0A8H7BH79_9FUNG|nr:hypothetical protein EC973_003472 [Apophysomyces ossiformis]